MGSFTDRLKHSWNVFRNPQEEEPRYDYNVGSYDRGGRSSSSSRFVTDRTTLASIYNRISVDVASIRMLHVRTDDNDRFTAEIDSGLNTCLTVEANIDQAARAFRQDMALTLLEIGCIAVVPVETSLNPNLTGGYDIKSLRVGTITSWYPKQIRTRVYDENVGERREIVIDKRVAAITENPFYSVMNEPNSTLQRLNRKLSYLDIIDKQSSAGKLDIIIQLPYVIKSESRRESAEKRRLALESQLKDSQYGIGYTDATEKITQLNRAAENQLLAQVQFLNEQLYTELGLTNEIMNGTADETAMRNYFSRTVEPILAALTEAMNRTFLTKTARAQNQTIMYFQDMFRLVPISQIAEIADKFTRNEILTSNEVRGLIGFRPAKDPGADELRNKNIPEAVPPTTDPEAPQPTTETETEPVPEKVPEGDNQHGS